LISWPERLAVGRVGVLLVRRAVPDERLLDDQGRLVGARLGPGERLLHPVEVVAVVDPEDVPPVGLEPGRDVLAERQVGVPVDGDGVVVVDEREVVELEVPGE
jgi:hypothetical protein